MLHVINKDYKSNDVISIKLTTGEEVIGYFVMSDSTCVVLRKPLVPVSTGQGQLALAPYLMTSDYMSKGSNITFAAHTVVTSDHTNKQIADAYTQQVSGITQVPKQPGLIT